MFVLEVWCYEASTWRYIYLLLSCLLLFYISELSFRLMYFGIFNSDYNF